jgi:hypothetical protein
MPPNASGLSLNGEDRTGVPIRRPLLALFHMSTLIISGCTARSLHWKSQTGSQNSPL